ncbi:AraC family transcriptional regulator ligand-binding domain-containing protein, partial [Mycobacterium tuberculosis]|nr:AraC family transcriptional regulator ligand-binding domain-containing protein [Mycobacterium tuberculosis]
HTLRIDGDVAELALTEHRDLGAMREFCLVTSLRFVLGYACWLVDSRIPLLESGLAFAPPPHADVYPLLFAPGPVQFE